MTNVVLDFGDEKVPMREWLTAYQEGRRTMQRIEESGLRPRSNGRFHSDDLRRAISSISGWSKSEKRADGWVLTFCGSEGGVSDTQPPEQLGGYDPKNTEDNRKRTMREITARQGQPAFRSGLLTAYKGRCAITGCAVIEVLEAAHITPYLGPETNHISNGLLLRSDLHTLWDSGQIYLDDDYTLQLSPTLFASEYESLAGRQITSPNQPALRPSLAAIQAHRMWALIGK